MTGRPVRVAAVQPPIAPGRVEATDTTAMLAAAFELLDQAGSNGCDVACLPELINVFGMTPAEAVRTAEPRAVAALLERAAASARRHGMWIVCPVLERRKAGLFNASKVLSRTGELVGEYDKTHLTDAEREWYGVRAGHAYPVFEADWGRFGIMTCYDAYFPEVARVLALDGADVVFFPSWQSGPSEIVMEVQMRARAIDQFVYVVRSSFGFTHDVAWRPGMFFGRSCVIDRDGTIMADAGHFAGVAAATIDMAKPRLMDVLDDGGDVRDLRRLTWRDRRPETYARISEPDDGDPDA